MTKDYQPEIDILKFLAIVAVISIHVTSRYLSLAGGNSKSIEPYLLFDSILRFCVPLFVALSGYGLAKKYTAVQFSLQDFVTRRLIKLLPQYLFWSTVIYFYIRHFFPQNLNPSPFWKIIFTGGADYHLYFVPVIFTLYAFFPLLLIFHKKWPKLLLIGAFLAQLVWYAQIAIKTEVPGLTDWSDQWQYRQLATWAFYFVLGMYLSQKNQMRSSRWRQYLLPIFAISSLIWTGATTLFLFHSNVDPIVATRFTRFSVLAYSLSIIGMTIIYKRYLSLIGPKWTGLIAFLGRNSYTVYLLHTIVIRVILDQLGLISLLPFWLGLALPITLSFLVANTFNRAVQWLGDQFHRRVIV